MSTPGYDHRISGLGFTDLRLWDLSEVTFRWFGLKALRVPHGAVNNYLGLCRGHIGFI